MDFIISQRKKNKTDYFSEERITTVRNKIIDFINSKLLVTVERWDRDNFSDTLSLTTLDENYVHKTNVNYFYINQLILLCERAIEGIETNGFKISISEYGIKIEIKFEKET